MSKDFRGANDFRGVNEAIMLTSYSPPVSVVGLVVVTSVATGALSARERQINNGISFDYNHGRYTL